MPQISDVLLKFSIIPYVASDSSGFDHPYHTIMPQISDVLSQSWICALYSTSALSLCGLLVASTAA